MLGKDQKGVNLFQIAQWEEYFMIFDFNSNSTITLTSEQIDVQTPVTFLDTSTGILIDGFTNSTRQTIGTNRNFVVLNVNL